jgi:hypothetical protein
VVGAGSKRVRLSACLPPRAAGVPRFASGPSGRNSVAKKCPEVSTIVRGHVRTLLDTPSRQVGGRPAGELRTLADAGLASIDLAYDGGDARGAKTRFVVQRDASSNEDASLRLHETLLRGSKPPLRPWDPGPMLDKYAFVGRRKAIPGSSEATHVPRSSRPVGRWIEGTRPSDRDHMGDTGGVIAGSSRGCRRSPSSLSFVGSRSLVDRGTGCMSGGTPSMVDEASRMFDEARPRSRMGRSDRTRDRAHMSDRADDSGRGAEDHGRVARW